MDKKMKKKNELNVIHTSCVGSRFESHETFTSISFFCDVD